MDHRVVVDFLGGRERPRWECISSSFYDSGVHAEDLMIAPLVHVDPRQRPFSLTLELKDGQFERSDEEKPLYDAQPKGNPLISYRYSDDNREVQLNWEGVPRNWSSDWGRWILYFRARDMGNTRRPVMIGFSTITPNAGADIAQHVVNQASDSRLRRSRPVVAEEVGGGPAGSLDVTLELLDGRPRFPGLFTEEFAPGSKTLPPLVYLEPLIVVKKRGVVIDFEFTSTEGLFSKSPAHECNPVLGNGEALALYWKGVTDSKSAGGPCSPEVARAFVGSLFVDRNGAPPSQKGCLRWREPGPRRNVDTTRRIASFFFVGTRRGIQGPSAASARVLVDPTIVYDEDEPFREG